MDSRERVLVALAGERPDRVPFALGFFSQSMFGAQDADEFFGTDVRFVEFDPPAEQEGHMAYLRSLPDDVHVGSRAQLSTYSEWRYHPETQSEHPLAGAVSPADVVDGLLPDLTDPRRHAALAAQVAAFHERGLAVAGAPPALGGELFESAYRLRGFQRFMLDLLEREALVDYILEQLTAMLARNAVVLAHAGVDVLLLDDDVASSHGLIISPDLGSLSAHHREAAGQWKEATGGADEAAAQFRVGYHGIGQIETWQVEGLAGSHESHDVGGAGPVGQRRRRVRALVEYEVAVDLIRAEQ